MLFGVSNQTRGNQTASLRGQSLWGDLGVEREAREAERGGERKVDGEPDEAAEHVALVGGGGFGGNGRLPVRPVAEVADDVDDAEHEGLARRAL